MTHALVICYTRGMKICPRCKTEQLLTSYGYCRSCTAAYGRERRKKYPEQARAYQRAYRRRVRIEVLQALGGRCMHCGNTDQRCLQIDHISGGGNQERQTLGPSRISGKISKGQTEGYQLLCANCNWIKKHEQQEHGHRF